MTDKVLITGASRGIGLATGKLLAAAGWHVVGIARRPSDEAFPGDFFAADLGDRNATAEVLERICAAHEIDCIVNSVGVNVPEPLGEVDLDHLARVFDLNVRTAVQCTQAVLPGMRRRRYGRIVNVSSRGALGRVKRTSYSAAKAGIVGMTRTWALELATEGITANVVSPGPTATEMFTRNNLEGPQGEENRRKFLADVPLGRFGQPEEIAFAIAFFLDRRAGFVTGQLLHACGGSSVGSAAL
jgi:NAD(P)-dependent dehydrogenase (short-subunit alcohol dehydrogenase family)